MSEDDQQWAEFCADPMLHVYGAEPDVPETLDDVGALIEQDAKQLDNSKAEEP